MFQTDDKGFSVRLPFGLRDIFPFEADERNSIKGIIGSEFKLWGYGEVKTPPVEFTSNMSIGVGKDWKNKLVNFFDIDGSLVSLRTDMTIPIARLTGMRIKKDQLPIRFCYFADSFRQSGMQKGIKRAYSQAGLELIGSLNSTKADTEILIILISLLEKLKVGDFKIGIGHIKVIEGLCEWFGLDSSGTEYIKKEIAAKNLVGVRNHLDSLDKEKTKLFIKLLQPEEDIEKTYGLISEVNQKKVIDGFKYLREVIEILGKMDYSKNVIIDFSIIRDFDYYTGLLFEVYSSKITRIIGSGGRYEGLIKKFGLDVAGTGFALDVDLVHNALGDRSLAKGYKILLNPPDGDHDFTGLVRIANKIREDNIIVELLFDRVQDLEGLAKDKNCNLIVLLDKDLKPVKVKDLGGDSVKKKRIENILKET